MDSFWQLVRNATDPAVLIRELHVPRKLRRKVKERFLNGSERPPYVEPTPWKICVMTMLSFLSTAVDSSSIFHCIDVVDFTSPTKREQEVHVEMRKLYDCRRPLTKLGAPHPDCVAAECDCLDAFFPAILDIHYSDLCRGYPNFAEVKANKRRRSATRTFENQCTMRICLGKSPDSVEQKNGQTWLIVNLKIFQNGKIQMTGCKSFFQARRAVQFLIDKLMEKAPSMRNKIDCMTQLRCFAMDPKHSLLEAIELSKQQRNDDGHRVSISRDVFQEILLHVDNEALFPCRAVSREFHEILHSSMFWKTKCERELVCECERDSKGQYFMKRKFNGRFNRMERCRRPEKFAHPRLLYTRYKALRRVRPFMVVEQFEDIVVAEEKVAMINSDFKVNFHLNLKRFCKILRREYHLQAEYNPDSYVAINLKYASPIPLPGETVETVISFFIFRTGSIIINSARSLDQEIDAYDFINRIIKKHYVSIWQAPIDDESGLGKRKRRDSFE